MIIFTNSYMLECCSSNTQTGGETSSTQVQKSKKSKGKAKKGRGRIKKNRKRTQSVSSEDVEPSEAQKDEEIIVKSPEDLIRKITLKDTNIIYKLEQSGQKISYMDLDLEIKGKELKVNIYWKPTHVWDLPVWRSRTTYPHKKASVVPLFIRAHRLIKDEGVRTCEITKIFNEAVKRGYPVRILKRWNEESKQIAGRPLNQAKSEKIYRNVTTSNIDTQVKNVLTLEGVEVVSRKTNTLFGVLRNDKDRRDALENPGVYRIPVERGGEVKAYIGRTQKAIKVRLEQHKEGIKNKSATTTLANAVVHEGWRAKWEDVKVLDKPKTLMRSVLSEYVEICNDQSNLVNTMEKSDRLECWRKAI